MEKQAKESKAAAATAFNAAHQVEQRKYEENATGEGKRTQRLKEEKRVCMPIISASNAQTHTHGDEKDREATDVKRQSHPINN